MIDLPHTKGHCLEMGPGAASFMKEIVKEMVQCYKKESTNRPSPRFIFVDELAEVMKDPIIQECLITISRLGRQVGFRLICATQRLDSSIPGQFRSNMGIQVAFKTGPDYSRLITGPLKNASRLNGQGDALVHYRGEVHRIQGFNVSSEDIKRVKEFYGRRRGRRV